MCTTPANLTAPAMSTAGIPSNPPPQRRSIMRSMTGMMGGDPSHVSLSPLLRDGSVGRSAKRSAICVPCFVFASF
jgi:hypothetical protein